jgi:hypothetical protein
MFQLPSAKLTKEQELDPAEQLLPYWSFCSIRTGALQRLFHTSALDDSNSEKAIIPTTTFYAA